MRGLAPAGARRSPRGPRPRWARGRLSPAPPHVMATGSARAGPRIDAVRRTRSAHGGPGRAPGRRRRRQAGGPVQARPARRPAALRCLAAACGGRGGSARQRAAGLAGGRVVAAVWGGRGLHHAPSSRPASRLLIASAAPRRPAPLSVGPTGGGWRGVGGSRRGGGQTAVHWRLTPLLDLFKPPAPPLRPARCPAARAESGHPRPAGPSASPLDLGSCPSHPSLWPAICRPCRRHPRGTTAR
jgi:hypothetical protein